MIGRVVATGGAVADSSLDTTSMQSIVAGARKQTGEIDPGAITKLEELAKRASELAASLKQTRELEQQPLVDLAQYPMTRQQLEAAGKTFLKEDPEGYYTGGTSLGGRASMAIRAAVLLTMSHSTTVVGGAANSQGGYDVVVRVSPMFGEPSATDPHYLVTVDASGGGKPKAVRVVSA